MASPHPAMLWGTAGEECDTRFVVVAVFQPLRPSDTSPIANATPRNTTGHGKGEV